MYLGTTPWLGTGQHHQGPRPNLAQAAGLMLNPWVAALCSWGHSGHYHPDECILYGKQVAAQPGGDGMMPRILSRLNRYNVPGLATITIYIPRL